MEEVILSPLYLAESRFTYSTKCPIHYCHSQLCVNMHTQTGHRNAVRSPCKCCHSKKALVDSLGRVSSETLLVCSSLTQWGPDAGAAPGGSCGHTVSSGVCSFLQNKKNASTGNRVMFVTPHYSGNSIN